MYVRCFVAPEFGWHQMYFESTVKFEDTEFQYEKNTEFET
jgi:hypothetical protein